MSIKKFLGTIVALAVFATTGATVYAQSGAPIQSATPDVFVRHVTTTQASYNAGDTVKGTFEITNESTYTVADVVYIGKLVGDYAANGLATQFYDSVTLGNVSLNAKETKKVSFSYKLPPAYAGNSFGIQIQAKLKSGSPLGWGDAKITITGTSSAVTVTDVAVAVGKDEYGQNEGPSVPEGQTATLKVTLKNGTKNTITLNPKVVIYDHAVTGTALTTISPSTFNLAAGAATTTTVTLPLFDRKPGVYVGTISFENADKQQVANDLTFRYILPGQLVTINSLGADKTAFAKGDQVALTLSYAGTPPDIATHQRIDNPKANFTIALYNEKNVQVGTYSGSQNFDEGTTANYTVTATGPAKAVRAEVVVQGQDGKQLADYKADLSPNYAEVAHASATSGASFPYMIIILGVIVAILILMLIRKRGRPGAAYMIALFFGLGALTLFPHNAFMFTVTHADFWGSGPYQDFVFSGVSIAVMQNGSLTPVSSVAPGQQYYLIGSVYSPACSNSLQQLNFITVSPSNTVTSTSLTTSWSLVNNKYSYSTAYTGSFTNWGTTTPRTYTPTNSEVFTTPEGQFSLGPMVAPTTVGTYHVQMRVLDWWANNINYADRHGDYAGFAEGYQDLVVTAPGSARIEVVGSAGTTASAPSGAQVQFSRSGSWLANPAFISNVATGATYDFWAKDPGSGYTKTVGICYYPGTGTCTPTSFSPVFCDGTECQANGVPVNTGSNNGTKVVFKYVQNTSPVTASCSASPNPASQNTSVTWTVSGVSGGNGTYAYTWSGSDGLSKTTANTTATSDSVSKSYSTSGTKTAVVAITSNGNTTNINCSNLTVSAPAAPTVTLWADPNVVDYNGSSLLKWTSANATACFGTNFNTGGAVNNTTGVSTGALQTTTTYTINCTGPGGSAQTNATVTVNPQVSSIACHPENPANPGTAIVQAPKDYPVKWVASGPSAYYEWTGTVTAGGDNLKSVTRIYTTVGLKQVTVRALNSSDHSVVIGQAQCDAGNFTVSDQPGYKEF